MNHNGIPIEEIRRSVERQREEWTEFLRRLVVAESPSTVPESQQEVFRILSQPLQEMGWQLAHLPGERSGGLLHFRPPSPWQGTRKQMLLGHSDTVWPIGTLQQMPAEVDSRRRTLKGPGSYDMKAGLTQIVFALKALHELGLKPEVSPEVLISSDEEVGSLDSEEHIRRLAEQSERVLVLEPSLGRQGRLKTARKGIWQFTIAVHGKASHAGLDPEGGASAILEMSYVIQKLAGLNDPEKGITVNVGTIEGGLRPNVVAPHCTASVDVRVLRQEDAQRVQDEVSRLKPVTAGVRLEVSPGLKRPPMERTPRNRALWESAVRLGREMGLELEEGLAGGASDGNLTSLYAATLDGLGAVGGGAHAHHEFVYLDHLAERTVLLALLLLAPVVS